MNREAPDGNCLAGFSSLETAEPSSRPGSQAPNRPFVETEKSLSALEIGIDQLGHFVDRHVATMAFAIDEKRWCRVDLELVDGPLAHRFDTVEDLLIRQACLKALVGEAPGLLGDRLEGLDRLPHRPRVLLLKQRLDHGEILVLAGTARQHEGASRDRIEGKLAEDESHLAGINVALLQLRKGILAEMRTVRAGHRS